MQGLLKNLIFIFLILFIMPAWADNDNENYNYSCADAINVMDCIQKTSPNIPPPIPVHNLMVNNFYGPLGLAVRYDSDLGWIPEINYTQMFFDNGIHILLDYNTNEERANVTLGHAFSFNQQIKFSYEYLAQNLPFDFASGETNEWVNQNAFGIAYRYLFPGAIFQGFDLTGYYIFAGNKDLSDIIYYQNNDAYLNLRRIAGGSEQTLSGGLILAPSNRLLINLGGGYSHLVYDTQYEDNQDRTAIAYHSEIEWFISPWTKLAANIANSAAETDSSIKISQIFPTHIEASLRGEYSQGQAGQPDSANLTLALSYPVLNYKPTADSLCDLKAWVEKPIIHMPRVLAIKDEKIVQYTVEAINPPAQSLLTGQMILPVYTNTIFNFDPAMYDKIVYSLSLVNDNPATPQTQLNIDIKPDGTSIYNSIIFSTAPLPNSTTPTGVQTIYHVIITALAYKNGLSAPIQAQADLELDINFNKENEPKWVATNGSIKFDASDTSTAINLNNLISQPGTPQAIRFYFDDANKYPNWDIKNFNGTWFLVRKPDANSYYDASDINSSTAQKIIVSVQYANDPDSLIIPGQTLSITVKPDNQISFAWLGGNSCKLSNLLATQPTNNQIYSLSLSPCVLYKDIDSNTVKVKNDMLSYSISNKNNYPADITLSGANDTVQMNVGGPTNSLNNHYAINFTVKSKAQGGENPAALNLLADDVISIGNTLVVNAQSGNPKNTYQFMEASTFITSVVVNGLDDNRAYQISSAVPAPSTTYTLESPGAIMDVTSYDNNKSNIVLYPSLIIPSKGQISIMWWSVSAYPSVSSITITS